MIVETKQEKSRLKLFEIDVALQFRQFQMQKWKMDPSEFVYQESNDFKGEKFVFRKVAGKKNLERVDTKTKQVDFALKSRLLTFLKNAFLPEGYPESVSDDYLTYQIWDTVQAFASSISGSLATQVS